MYICVCVCVCVLSYISLCACVHVLYMCVCVSVCVLHSSIYSCFLCLAIQLLNAVRPIIISTKI